MPDSIHSEATEAESLPDPSNKEWRGMPKRFRRGEEATQQASNPPANTPSCTCAVTISPGKPMKVDRSHCPIHYYLQGRA